MFSALAVIVFRTLPLSKQQMVVIRVKTGELVLDSLEETYPTNKG